MNHKFDNNTIEIFPSIHIMEFEISLNSKEIVQKLDILQQNFLNSDLDWDYDSGTEPDWRFTTLAWTPWAKPLHKEEFSSLKNKLLHCLQEYNKRFNVCTGKIEITNSWFKFMEEGIISKFHVHDGSLLSGSYYPLLPEGAANLSVIIPEKERKEIPIKEGHLYVFPSWLEHGVVDINNCDKRVCIGFNTTDVTVSKYIEEFEKINQHSTNEMVGDELEKFIAASSSKNITEFMLAGLKLNQK